MTARCAACRRRLHAPSPDGYGPKCRRKLTPVPTPGRSDTPPAGPTPGGGQLALAIQSQLPEGDPTP
jgi:hypothetical protein